MSRNTCAQSRSAGAQHERECQASSGLTVSPIKREDMRRKAEQSPYPRLRALLAALDGTKPVADRHGFRFADPVTGKEIWLCDIH
jgi:hypothetical protein